MLRNVGICRYAAQGTGQCGESVQRAEQFDQWKDTVLLHVLWVKLVEQRVVSGGSLNPCDPSGVAVVFHVRDTVVEMHNPGVFADPQRPYNAPRICGSANAAMSPGRPRESL